MAWMLRLQWQTRRCRCVDCVKEPALLQVVLAIALAVSESSASRMKCQVVPWSDLRRTHRYNAMMVIAEASGAPVATTAELERQLWFKQSQWMLCGVLPPKIGLAALSG